MHVLNKSNRTNLLATSVLTLLPHTALAQTPIAPQIPQPAPAVSEYAQWETVARYERYGPTDRQPGKVDTRVFKHCSRPQDQSIEEVMKQEDMMQRLKNHCWVSQKREEAGRSQVKWACKDGMTAEIAARKESPSRIGYMMVFNVPGQGATSIRAESLKVADSCEAPGNTSRPPA